VESRKWKVVKKYNHSPPTMLHFSPSTFMDYEELVNKIKPELKKVIEYLQEQINEIRTSRPSAAMIDSLTIECFGKKFPLKSLATIGMTEKREIIIQPWDISYLEPIEKAIFNSPLELSPVIQEGRIIVSFPPLTEELRQKMARLVAEKAEKATQTIRHWRKESRQEIDDLFSESELSEDEKYKARKKLDELTGEYNDKINEMVERKKKEIIE